MLSDLGRERRRIYCRQQQRRLQRQSSQNAANTEYCKTGKSAAETRVVGVRLVDAWLTSKFREWGLFSSKSCKNGGKNDGASALCQGPCAIQGSLDCALHNENVG